MTEIETKHNNSQQSSGQNVSRPEKDKTADINSIETKRNNSHVTNATGDSGQLKSSPSATSPTNSIETKRKRELYATLDMWENMQEDARYEQLLYLLEESKKEARNNFLIEIEKCINSYSIIDGLKNLKLLLEEKNE